MGAASAALIHVQPHRRAVYRFFTLGRHVNRPDPLDNPGSIAGISQLNTIRPPFIARGLAEACNYGVSQL